MGPRTFAMCYICGRQFGSKSINFHEPQCLQKWMNENNKLPPKQRLPHPRKPGGSLQGSPTFGFDDDPLPERPRTATLEKPRVLNASNAKVVDMTSHRVERPTTITLPRPTVNPKAVPHIVSKKGGSKPPAHKRTTLNNFRRNTFVKADTDPLAHIPLVDPPPEPCTSCGRNSLPERFHSHPSRHGDRQHNTRAKSRLTTKNPNINHNSDKISEKPRNFLVRCTICGGDFESLALADHEQRCLEKHKLKGANTTKYVYLPSPIETDENQNMKSPLYEPCPHCGRTFFPDRLQVHLRGCKEKTRQAPRKEQSSGEPQANHPPLPKRRLVVCYLCGREFGSKSISIHEPQCLKKWHIENEKLPKHLQRGEPRKPDIILTEDGSINYDALADAAWQAHLDQLVQCPNCPRKFNPDRLEKHFSYCKPQERIQR